MKTTKQAPAAEESHIRCPFCTEGKIPAEPGKTACQSCGAAFEIDDRVESIFVDLEEPRLPLEGTYCRGCGLLQPEESEECLYCGESVRAKWQ